MITLVVRTLDENGARDVKGVIWFRYDEARMNVSVSHPKESKPHEIEEESFQTLRCVAKISEWTNLPKREVLDGLRSGKTRVLEVAPLHQAHGGRPARDGPGGPPSGEGPPGPPERRGGTGQRSTEGGRETPRRYA